MRSKNFTSAIIILVILLYFGYDAMTSGPNRNQAPAPSATVSDTPPASGAVSTASYGLNTANTWPPVEKVSQNVPISDDLFAVNYYIVLDGSGSMNETQCADGKRKIDVARTALDAFAQSLSPSANLGLAAFDTQGLSERVPLARDNNKLFFNAVHKVQSNGGTPLASAVKLAYTRLLEQGRRQLGYGEYHLVIVTDGLASSGQSPTNMVNNVLAESPVVFHTIGFCIGENHPLNQPARTYYRTANNPEALTQGLKDVLAEAPEFSVSQFDGQ